MRKMRELKGGRHSHTSIRSIKNFLSLFDVRRCKLMHSLGQLNRCTFKNDWSQAFFLLRKQTWILANCSKMQFIQCLDFTCPHSHSSRDYIITIMIKLSANQMMIHCHCIHMYSRNARMALKLAHISVSQCVLCTWDTLATEKTEIMWESTYTRTQYTHRRETKEKWREEKNVIQIDRLRIYKHWTDVVWTEAYNPF